MAIETDPAGTAPGVEAYFELVRAFPLRPIRSDLDHLRAIEAIEAVADRRHRWVAGEEDYFLVLAMLIERYESEIYPDPPETE
jgi:HTH-type transcriptional regulator / antitoxin HigA